jgi:hypothetical protein
MLRKFREVTPDVVILIFFVSLLVWAAAFWNQEVPSSLDFDKKPMPLFSLILPVANFSPLISVIIAYLLVLLTAFLLVDFNTSQFFIGERTFLPGLMFVLFSGLLPAQQILNPVLPAAVFLVLAIRKIMDTYKAQGIAYSFYDAGLLISTGSLFYAGLIWFGILVIIGIALLRTGNLREIIIAILGLATPWFLTGGVYYVTGKDLNDLISLINYNLSGKEIVFSLSRLTIVVLTVTMLILLRSLVHLLSSINTKKIRSRKTFILLIWTFIIAISFLLLLKSVSYEILWLAYIPASFIISHYFVFSGRKKFFPFFLFIILFAEIALIQVLSII